MFRKRSRSGIFLRFSATGAQNLFLDSKSTPRTFNALEAIYSHKNQKKRYNGVVTEVTTTITEESKSKLKEKWVTSHKRFSLPPFS